MKSNKPYVKEYSDKGELLNPIPKEGYRMDTLNRAERRRLSKLFKKTK